MDTKPPRMLMLALAAARIHQILSLVVLGAAVWLEGPEVTSTWNFYHQLLNVPRAAFPLLCFFAAGAVIIGSVLIRRNILSLAMVMAIAGIPFVMYCAGATFFVYGILEGRTFVTFALYSSAGVGYYVLLMLVIAIGLWVEYARLDGRHRE